MKLEDALKVSEVIHILSGDGKQSRTYINYTFSTKYSDYTNWIVATDWNSFYYVRRHYHRERIEDVDLRGRTPDFDGNWPSIKGREDWEPI